MVGHISRTADSSTHFPTGLSTKTHRTHIFIDKKMKQLLRPLMSRHANMFPPVDISKVVGSTVHSKSICVMAEVECNRLYVSQKKVKMVEGVVINVDLKITKQR